MRETTVGIGAGAENFTGEAGTTDMVLNIGPQHPATHGVLRLRLLLDGERIVTAEPVIGYMHRGAEKLFEARDYRQIIMLANRHDWLSAFSNELGVVLGVERGAHERGRLALLLGVLPHGAHHLRGREPPAGEHLVEDLLPGAHVHLGGRREHTVEVEEHGVEGGEVRQGVRQVCCHSTIVGGPRTPRAV